MGVEKQVLQPGNGPKPAAGQSVTVHCTGFGLYLFLPSFLLFLYSYFRRILRMRLDDIFLQNSRFGV